MTASTAPHQGTAPHQDTPRSDAARVPLSHDGLLARALSWYSRRSYGQDLDPLQALLHNRRVAMSLARLEMSLAKWHRLDTDLKELATLAVAAQIGCSWCQDFGYYVSRTRGMSAEKLQQVGSWRESELYSPLERQVLAYAEAMTATPPTVTDEMVAGLREQLSDAELVELTEMISVENLRSRTNAALGLSSQGFTSRCDLPGDLPASQRR